jgi:iron complex outermembrane receptor protein
MKKTKYTFAAAALATLFAISMNAQVAPALVKDAASSDEPISMQAVVVRTVDTVTANNVADKQTIALQTPVSSVLNSVKYLPGVNISQGDAFGGDDWSTRITIRGFNELNLGFTVDGVGTGFTSYAGGAKPNRFIDAENVASVVVSQGAGDISSASTQALGGTLAYFTDSPLASPSFVTSLTYGSFQTTRTQFRVDTGTYNDNSRAYVSFSFEQNNNWVGDYVDGSAPATTKRYHIDAKNVSQLGNVKVTSFFTLDNVNPEINFQGVTTQQFRQDPHNDQLTFSWTGNPVIDQNFAPTWTTVRTNTLLYTKFELPVCSSLNFIFQPYWAHQNGKGEFLPPYQIRRFTLAGAPSSLGDYVPASIAAVGGQYIFYQDASGNDMPHYNPVNPAMQAANPYAISTYTWLTPAQQAAAHEISTARFSRYQNNRTGDNFSFIWNSSNDNQLTFGGWNEDQERYRHRTWHNVVNPLISPAYNSGDYLDQFRWSYTTITNMIYGHDQYTLGNLKMEAGIKYFNVSVKSSNSLPNSKGLASYSAKISSNSDLLPSFGAIYKLDSANELFASYSKNFEAVQDSILEAGAGGTDITLVKPETADNFELGYRYSSKDFALSASVYDIQFKNMIVNLSGLAAKNYSNASSGVYTNIGGTKSKGVELGANYKLTNGLSALLTLSTTSATYTTSTPDGAIIAGKKVVDTPSLITSYGFLYSRGGFSTSLIGKTTGERYSTYSNDNSAPDYTVYDFDLGYRRNFEQAGFFKSVSFDLAVNNLLDTSYLSNVSINDQGYVGSDASGSTMLYNIGAPRTITFTVKLGF